MMISITIDTSFFMLPEKKEDVTPFFKRLWKLFKLEENNFVTVNYMNNIPNNLGFVKTEVDGEYEINIIDRKGIEERLAKIASYNDIYGEWSTVYSKYIEKLWKICPRPNKSRGKGKKGKIGIYENIPERNRDPDEQYSAIGFNPDIYFEKLETSVLLRTFKNYLGYLAYLNNKYASEDRNYIVLKAERCKEESPAIKITTMKDNSEVPVNVVGINTIFNVCRGKNDKEFDSLAAVFEESKRHFNQIVFGKNVKNSSFTEVLSPTLEQAQKVYLYLKTLNEIVGIIKERNISNETTGDDNIVELLNAHGLLCSPEDKETMDYGFRKYNCRQRTLDNGAGKDILFNFHLKPITGKKRNGRPDEEHTVRIYIAWDSERKKIIVGWMAHHLPECGKDKIDDEYTGSDCPSIECLNNPLNPGCQRNLNGNC